MTEKKAGEVLKNQLACEKEDRCEGYCEECQYHKSEEDWITALNVAISALKKQEQNRWIPVTERLPEVKQRVLAQRKDGFMEVKICIDGGHLAWFYSGIVAWRPLPEPYTEEKE